MFENGCYTTNLARVCLREFFVERTWIELWKILVPYNCTQLWAKLVTWQVVSGRSVVVRPRIYTHSSPRDELWLKLCTIILDYLLLLKCHALRSTLELLISFSSCDGLKKLKNI